MKLAALIFDVDGTLAETEELHRLAFNAAFTACGLSWHWDPALYGRLLEVTGGKERIRHYISSIGGLPAIDTGTIARLHADKTARYTDMVRSGALTLRPGIRRLLDEAQAAGIPVAIATTTSPDNVTALLRATLGEDGPARFAVIAAGDCVPAKKPAPDIYRLVLERLGVQADSAIAFEDTPNGLRAARGAGIATVITLSQYAPPEGYDGALAVLPHLGDPGNPCQVFEAPTQFVTLPQLKSWQSGLTARE